jgi:hypothetical protein
MVAIGVGGGSRRSGEEEAGGIARRQHHAVVAARLVTGGVCVCVCGLLELIITAMTPHPSGSGHCPPAPKGRPVPPVVPDPVCVSSVYF